MIETQIRTTTIFMQIIINIKFQYDEQNFMIKLKNIYNLKMN